MAKGLGAVTDQLITINESINRWGVRSDQRLERIEEINSNFAKNLSNLIEVLPSLLKIDPTTIGVEKLDLSPIKSLEAIMAASGAAPQTAQPGSGAALSSPLVKSIRPLLQETEKVSEILFEGLKLGQNQSKILDNVNVSLEKLFQGNNITGLTQQDILSNIQKILKSSAISSASQEKILKNYTKIISTTDSGGQINLDALSVNNDVSISGGTNNLKGTSFGLALAIAAIPGFAKRVAKAITEMNNIFASAAIPPGTSDDIEKRNAALQSFNTIFNTISGISLTDGLKTALIMPIFAKKIAQAMVDTSDIFVNNFTSAFAGQNAAQIKVLTEAPGNIFGAIRDLATIKIFDLLKNAIVFKAFGKQIGTLLGDGLRDLVTGLGSFTFDLRLGDKVGLFETLIEKLSSLPMIRLLINLAFFKDVGEKIEKLNLGNAFNNLSLQLKNINKPLLNKIGHFEKFINIFAKLPFIRFGLGISSLKRIGKQLLGITPNTFPIGTLGSILKVNKPLLTKMTKFGDFITAFAKLPFIRFMLGLKLLPIIGNMLNKLDPSKFSFDNLEEIFKKVTPSFIKRVDKFKDLADKIASIPWGKMLLGISALTPIGLATMTAGMIFMGVNGFWDELNEGAEGLKLFFDKLAIIDTSGINKLVKSLALTAGALSLLGISLLVFGAVKPTAMIKAGAALVAFAGITKLFEKIRTEDVLKASFALSVFGAAMLPLGFGLALMNGVKLTNIAVLAGSLAVLTVAANYIAEMDVMKVIKGAAALAALGIAMMPLGLGLAFMNGVKPATVGVAALALGALGIAAAIFGAFAPAIAPGVSILALLGLSMLPLGLGLMALSAVKWDNFKPMHVFATLSAIGLGSIPLVLGAPGMLLGGIAMLPLALGLGAMSLIKWDNFKPDIMFKAIGAIAIASIPLLLAAPGMLYGGIAMLPLALGLTALSFVRWSNLRGFSILSALSAIGLGSIPLLLAAPGMATGGVAMLPLAAGLKIMGDVKWANFNPMRIFKTLSAFGLGGLALLPGVLGLLLGGPGILLLSAGLGVMSLIKWDKFDPKKIYNALQAIISGTDGLLWAAPGMLLGGLAMLPLAAGLFALSYIGADSINAIGESIANLVASTDGLLGAALAMALGGIAMLPLAAGLFAIKLAAPEPETLQSLTTFIKELSDALKNISILRLVGLAMAIGLIGIALLPLAAAGAAIAALGNLSEIVGKAKDFVAEKVSGIVESGKQMIDNTVEGGVDFFHGATGGVFMDEEYASDDIAKAARLEELKKMEAGGDLEDSIFNIGEEEKRAELEELRKWEANKRKQKELTPAQAPTSGIELNKAGSMGSSGTVVINNIHQGGATNINSTSSTNNTSMQGGGGPIITGSASGGLGYGIASG